MSYLYIANDVLGFAGKHAVVCHTTAHNPEYIKAVVQNPIHRRQYTYATLSMIAQISFNLPTCKVQHTCFGAFAEVADPGMVIIMG